MPGTGDNGWQVGLDKSLLAELFLDLLAAVACCFHG
jgi:hypothetical protein